MYGSSVRLLPADFWPPETKHVPFPAPYAHRASASSCGRSGTSGTVVLRSTVALRKNLIIVTIHLCAGAVKYDNVDSTFNHTVTLSALRRGVSVVYNLRGVLQTVYTALHVDKSFEE
jgi:hypothetical protein